MRRRLIHLVERRRERRPVSPRAHEIAAWAALALLIAIVITGAGVRLTGSGLGCPTWPKCTGGSLTPADGHAYIEFGNRLITAPVVLATFACLLLGALRAPYRRDFTVLGAALLGLTLAQGVLGGITVLTGLNPVTVSGHFLLSMVTIYLAVLLVWRVREERSGAAPAGGSDRQVVQGARALTGLGALVVFLGTMVTASGPHAGGEGTGDDVERLTIFGLDTFRTVIMIHARVAAVFGVLLLTLWFVARRRDADPRLRRALTVTTVLTGAAGLVGHLQYHVLDYPESVVWLHVATATLLWGALCWTLVAAGRPAPAPARAAQPA